MKKVVFLSLLATSVAFVSCKETPQDPQTTPEVKDLAIAETAVNTPKETYLYVNAATGLSLREYNNLSSEKLAIMPYGTKVQVITAEEKPTMTVGGIKGGMHEVSYNHKKGYAFNGYLSRFFPPEEDIKPAIYAEDLKGQFPKVIFTETTGGTATKPSNTETLVLPNATWHEGYFIAQRLFKIPREFTFPPHTGKSAQKIKNPKPSSRVRVSELNIERKDKTLQKIKYTHASDGFGYTVTITQEGENIKLERTEVVD